jgi:SAM-dependent methyltransferase
MPLTYDPTIFQVKDLAAAKNIILTPEDSSTEVRWENETPYVADLIGQFLPINHSSLLLDYGCGIGRVAKELIARYGCHVIGIDISASMREFAQNYVGSDRFFACSPVMLDCLITNGVSFDGAVAIWVLQHCFNPTDDIARIRRTLKPNGRLFVLNNLHRVVPTLEKGWYNDGVDVRTLLCSEFALLQEGRPAPQHTSPLTAKYTYWAAFNQRP